MALDFIGDIVGGIASGLDGGGGNDLVLPGIGGNKSLDLGSLIKLALGAYGVANPQKPFDSGLIDQALTSNSKNEDRLASAEKDRQIAFGSQSKALDVAQRLLAAGMDPNSQLFGRLVAEQMRDSGKGLATGLNQYRDYMHRYGTGIVNPERRDENVAKAAASGFDDAQQRARDNVRDYLTKTAEANRAIAGTYNSGGAVTGGTSLGTAMTASSANQQAKASGNETNFGNIVSGLVGAKTPTNSQPAMPSRQQDISWNNGQAPWAGQTGGPFQTSGGAGNTDQSLANYGQPY